MQVTNFSSLFPPDQIVLLDGASGTQMIEAGMPAGVCPEAWAAEHPQALKRMYQRYVQAGSQAVYAFTFGANRYKLAEYGLAEQTAALNTRLVQITREAVGDGIRIGGDMSPTGAFVEPFGDMKFEQAVQIYAEQAKALADAGVDFFIIETMLDLQEARAAVLGVKQVSDLPVCVTMTFDESGRTLTGSDPQTVAITLCALGVDAVGANCGLGPASMVPIIAQMASVATVPVIAKPNAGLPTGETLDADAFCQQALPLVEAGARVIGGCCGTDAAHIRTLQQALQGKTCQIPVLKRLPSVLTASAGRTALGFDQPFCTIGERINPTGKKKMQQALREHDEEAILHMATEQRAMGARALDINVGMAGIDEQVELPRYVLAVAGRVNDMPLCIDSANMDALEKALRVYPGRALVNSVSAEKGRAERLFPVIARYGAMYIALPIGDDGVPMQAEERIALVEQLLKKADSYGIDRSACVVDALALSVASEPDAGREALKVIQWCKAQGLNSSMGVSNSSFGLPARPMVNTAMLVASQACGMTAAIVNPCEETMHQALYASAAILEGGTGAARYAQEFGGEQQPAPEGLFGAVVAGEKGRAEQFTHEQIAKGVKPQQLVEQDIIPALDRLGVLFAEKTVFLPQLMAGAEAAKRALAILEPLMVDESAPKKATAVIATVKGDIHDIGKNIVALMLKNHGFTVVDLGRDVPNEEVIRAAEEHEAAVVLLSALLTTTMDRMGECAEMMRQKQMKSALMVGGAVVTPAFAEQIGALYSADAAEAVEVAKRAARERGFAF